MTECPAHRGEAVVGTCHRCGRFICAAEALRLDGEAYCGDCGRRDDVDWLGAYGRRLEGRRSGLASLLLVLGGLAVAMAVTLLSTQPEGWPPVLVAVGLLAFGLPAMAFVTGWRYAPEALVVGAAAYVLLGWLASTPLSGVLAAALVGPLAVSAFTDVATRLFLRRPVTREALRKHHQRYGDNPLAVTASRLALLGLFVPGLGVVSLLLGVVAWTRVDPEAVPPVGNRSVVAGAIVFSLFTLALWGAVLFLKAW